MKHGKAKSKAASKATAKKSSKSSATDKVSAKSSPVSKKQQASSSSKSGAPGNGKPTRLAPGDVNFANAVVGNAFKRAVKKYPNAFRRLTD